MIISSAPCRLAASCDLGNPLCCRAYGKIVYISRSRSRSVSTAPFTLATGLSLTSSGEVCAEAGVPLATVVGGCDANCADTMAAPRKIERKSCDFILPHLLISHRYYCCTLSAFCRTGSNRRARQICHVERNRVTRVAKLHLQGRDPSSLGMTTYEIEKDPQKKGELRALPSSAHQPRFTGIRWGYCWCCWTRLPRRSGIDGRIASSM